MVNNKRVSNAIVKARLERLQKAFLAGQPWSKATLAHLREAIGKEPGSIPEIWQITSMPVPEEWHSDKPTWEEKAAHWVFVLYARHQQSKTQPMHSEEKSAAFGRAVRNLTNSDDQDDSPINRRIKATISADTLDSLCAHMSGLISQLRSNEIPLNYVQLYDDLVLFQQPGGADTVRRRWARDYVNSCVKPQEDDGDSDGNKEEAIGTDYQV
ncbi:type I-E CRISPR-associated protein Cse2/CasB [Arcanobacterium hippocoleae]|uniref:CRISPR system Cascade subunit CasB n=1 Tax=Arcanobacterium hippocoleae TaxID=149017 RepID=A0ABU1T208_9ACTO|nr:type I-E CRISPR-associated protein Cse2/CasB [Arcanobacterium hippocoleae]MDR6939334.1 CRISPR system Cascade subunit CasB [Arcanobacterium hippocoleae]